MQELASDFRLLGDLESVVDLDAEVPHSAYELRMAKQQLHGSHQTVAIRKSRWSEHQREGSSRRSSGNAANNPKTSHY